jgi:hypothetical protein
MEAEQEITEAKKIDSAKIDRYMNEYSENYNRLLIDEIIPKKRLLVKSYFLFRKDLNPADELWDLLFRGVSMQYGTGLFFCVLAIALILSKKDKYRAAIQCKLCGKSICKRCQRSAIEHTMCYQCLNLLKKQDAGEYRLKEEQKYRITLYLNNFNIIGTVLSILFPGSCYLWKGQPLKGSIFIFCYFFLLLKVTSVFLIEGPLDFVVSCKTPEIIFLLIFLAFFWFFSLLDALKIKDKSLEDNLSLIRN